MSEEKDFYYYFGKMLYKENEYLQVRNMKLIEENQQLKDRINKSIEYIEDKLKIYPKGLVGEHLGQEFLKNILDLLKGDKE